MAQQTQEKAAVPAQSDVRQGATAMTRWGPFELFDALEEEKARFWRSPWRMGPFAPGRPLPFEASPEQITATFSDGVLEIAIPRPVAAQPKPQQIAVG